MASDEIPDLTVSQLNAGETGDSSLSNLVVVDQLGEILGTTGDGPGGTSGLLTSTPLRLISVGDGQFMLAKITEVAEVGCTEIEAVVSQETVEGLGLPIATDEKSENCRENIATQMLATGVSGKGTTEAGSGVAVLDSEQQLREQLAVMHGEILSRLDVLAQRLNQVGSHCKSLEDRLQDITNRARAGYGSATATLIPRAALAPSYRGKGNTVAVCMPLPINGSGSGKKSVSLSSNRYEDYPSGCWLGDPSDPELRVRCPIRPQDLELLNKSCATPEKMALTLLDYLFDREVQAASNISGTGRHGKQQLDPLRIFGIRCHLVYHFGISEKDWHRIKQNLDSKCRTAFRRKIKGMPLTVKAFRDRAPTAPGQAQTATVPPLDVLPSSPECSLAASQSDVSMDNDLDLVPAQVPVTLISSDVSLPLQARTTGEPQIIHTEHGDIQVVHATAEQIAQMEQSQQIQILASGEVLEDLQAHTEALVGAP